MDSLANRSKNICFGVVILALALMPALMTTGAVGAPLVIFLGKCMAFAIVAIGLDLIWGYTGILSLGHGLFFSLGAYAMAMHLKLQATGGEITDFMRTGGLTELPLVWKLFQYLPQTIILVVALPAALAYLLGFFTFKNRVKGVYFSIISQALTWAAYSLFIALSPYTNGNVGITEIKSLLGGIRGGAGQLNLIVLFYASLLVLALAYALATFLVGAKFGKLLVAIRDGENRAYFSGYKVSRYKSFVYAASAGMAGAAGALFVNFNGSVTPSQMTVAFSINMIIWVAIGGRGTIIGPVIGALLVNLCEYNLSSGGMVEVWQYIIGGVFCAAILFFKGGIVGIFAGLAPTLPGRARSRDKNEPPPNPGIISAVGEVSAD